MTYSDVLFCLGNSEKLKDIQFDFIRQTKAANCDIWEAGSSKCLASFDCLLFCFSAASTCELDDLSPWPCWQSSLGVSVTRCPQGVFCKSTIPIKQEAPRRPWTEHTNGCLFSALKNQRIKKSGILKGHYAAPDSGVKRPWMRCGDSKTKLLCHSCCTEGNADVTSHKRGTLRP